MSGDFLKFENVEWDFLQIGEDLFRKKRQGSIQSSENEFLTIEEDVLHYISFIEHVSKNRAKDQEENLITNKKLLDKYKRESIALVEERAILENEAIKLKEKLDASEEELKNLSLEREELLECRIKFNEEVKNTYTAFLSAKTFYKDRLKMYFSINNIPDSEDKLIMIEFFTSKKEKNSPYSAVIRSHQTDLYTLVDVSPKLSVFKQLARRLKETGDVPGLLCCIRKCFIKMNVHSEKPQTSH